MLERSLTGVGSPFIGHLVVQMQYFASVQVDRCGRFEMGPHCKSCFANRIDRAVHGQVRSLDSREVTTHGNQLQPSIESPRIGGVHFQDVLRQAQCAIKTILCRVRPVDPICVNHKRIVRAKRTGRKQDGYVARGEFVSIEVECSDVDGGRPDHLGIAILDDRPLTSYGGQVVVGCFSREREGVGRVVDSQHSLLGQVQVGLDRSTTKRSDGPGVREQRSADTS